MADATLVILGGLPGAGKTTLAESLCRSTGFAHVRVDSIQQALADVGALDADEIAPYAAAMAAARDILACGVSVVADSVNPVAASRAGWLEVAASAGARPLQVEVTCGDRQQHRRRATSRATDVPGLVKPSWAQIEARDYEPWAADLVVDTAVDDVAAAVTRIRKELS
ncbi:AAA family ATPase [Flexivirga meconopsidis]|uniref:AAA family ATPase n=1 Tax=Flexivirga meconopsidis TaxID=2977121 RepID=UPI00223F2537|nr:AAA family ATPase [Flexivirga meconopsidis]